jgi:formylglycine-generating enzyme
MATTLLGLVSLVSLSHGADPATAAPESRAQIAQAVRALGPFLQEPTRALPHGAPGTIEHAILAYAPQRAWAVTEGALLAPSLVPAASACPSDMSNINSRFCVDRYEGSLVTKTADGTLEPWPHNQPLAADTVYIARSIGNVLPQGYISGAQAEQACKQAGKRLCQPVEWRAACGGSHGFAYPYGPKRIPGQCKDRGTAPMMQLHADTMKRGWGMKELNDPRNLELTGTVERTGAKASCVSDQGVFDMVGNLHEWTADPNGTFQGGYFLDTSEHGDGCAYRTIAHGFTYHDYSTGFRCCKDPG